MEYEGEIIYGEAIEMDSINTSSAIRTQGVKGSDVYTTTSNFLVDLFTLLVRKADKENFIRLMNKVLALNTPQNDDDLFVLTFQTRDVRGGKGERDLFTEMFLHLYKHKKSLAVPLLALIPEFGCWRDVFVLMERDADLKRAFTPIVLKQLEDDELLMRENKPVSLLAKWMPRESSEPELTKYLALSLFPSIGKTSQRLAAYRKRVSALNKYLKTTEIAMCAGDWEEIEPGKVPGRCLAKHIKAFLNEVAPKKKNEHVIPGQLRHPDDHVRMACREHFKEHLAKAAEGKAKVNGAVTRYPHEIVKKVAVTTEESEKNALIAVWNDMVKLAKAGGGLGKTIAMCDFSGSMRMGSNGDTPYWVSMAMGMLISEVTSDEFKDTFLTFDSTPKWHTLPAGNIFDRMASIAEHIGQGTSTDFQKAMDLVLATLKQKRVKAGEEPKDLIVITDMNWDQAASSASLGRFTGNSYRHVVKTAPWQTHIQMIREAFKRAGEDMWGEGQGWKPPRIVIWNVAASSMDFHAQADEEGVIMLAGWSPSLLKVLMEEGAKVQTPVDALRAVLDAERYDVIRQALGLARARSGM